RKGDGRQRKEKLPRRRIYLLRRQRYFLVAASVSLEDPQQTQSSPVDGLAGPAVIKSCTVLIPASILAQGERIVGEGTKEVCSETKKIFSSMEPQGGDCTMKMEVHIYAQGIVPPADTMWFASLIPTLEFGARASSAIQSSPWNKPPSYSTTYMRNKTSVSPKKQVVFISPNFIPNPLKGKKAARGGLSLFPEIEMKNSFGLITLIALEGGGYDVRELSTPESVMDQNCHHPVFHVAAHFLLSSKSERVRREERVAEATTFPPKPYPNR
ncbi:hypothetical protein C0J52_16856, partial [Blattella germanica]